MFNSGKSLKLLAPSEHALKLGLFSVDLLYPPLVEPVAIHIDIPNWARLRNTQRVTGPRESDLPVNRNSKHR